MQYIIRHFKRDAKFIFDGYDQQLSTKSAEHARRALKKVSASIFMDGSMSTTTLQADFLGNVKNKGRLIKLLTLHLMNAGIDVQQARSDADSMISSALNVSDKPTVVVGTDTDLLVALICRARRILNCTCSAPAVITSQCLTSRAYRVQWVNARIAYSSYAQWLDVTPPQLSTTKGK